MQVLQWAIDDPDQIDRAVVVAASSRLTPENIAFSSVAREAIMNDPEFHGGRYVEHGTVPRLGQKVARMMAHITYVSNASLETKFGHRRDTTGDDWRMGPDFAVEHYLQHQGETFLDRFDALSYLYLTRLLDYFDPFADPWTEERLRCRSTRFQVTSFDSDWRFDTAQSLRARGRAGALRGQGRPRRALLAVRARLVPAGAARLPRADRGVPGVRPLACGPRLSRLAAGGGAGVTVRG